MNQKPRFSALKEPSLADALKLIEADPLLPAPLKSQWSCSIRRIICWIGRMPEQLPARMTSLRHPVGRLNAASVGVSPKTLSNHKANLRAALNHLSGETRGFSRGTPLQEPWLSIYGNIQDPWAKKRVCSFFRYLSAHGVRPDTVDDGCVAAFFAFRAETTFNGVGSAVERELARAWNSCIGSVDGFPEVELGVPTPAPKSTGPGWEDFPESFRAEIDRYLDTLKRPHRSANGKRRKACKPSTIETRRRELVAAARMLVRQGTPVAGFRSLRDLIGPKTVSKLLEAYWQRNGERPKNYTIDLAWKLSSIAALTGCLSEDELEQLSDLRFELENHRQHGLTEKNMKVIRAVISGTVWNMIVNLPDRLMKEAYAVRDRSPVKAAVIAQIAVAIRILTFMPLRVGNLAAIRLGENLSRPDGPSSPYWLHFPDYDVKNRVELSSMLRPQVSDFIDHYIDDFRPTLLRGSNTQALFPPGENLAVKCIGRSKRSTTLSDQITRRIEKELGFRITAHQFRHAAAAIILKDKPGSYEDVRRILGHRNIQTTLNFYVALESLDVSEEFAELIASQFIEDWDEADD